MQLLWLSLLLSVPISGISGGPTLLQSSEVLQVQTDQEAKISCEIRSAQTTHAVYWFRQLRPFGANNPYQFLAHSNPRIPSPPQEGNSSQRVLVSGELHRSTLKLLKMQPSDSGVYICAIIPGPQLVFGRGTLVNVVDVLPTTAKPTKKTTPRRRVCNTKSSDVAQQNGTHCNILPLSLLAGCAMVLLISLIVIIRLNYLWNLARHHFVKQLHR
ncbi:T-cell surface glycoprotein CD8 beta chain [Antechinus flavipes]|uniref:T-cell surface glycoprotein CD8 beta chain n=1 Tax=Antechinus flavipes TaxID=38775 RepID=UPI00223591E7|nr:T-cell surface glycoprotein CD8 beta chain [Antechinus flavipes]